MNSRKKYSNRSLGFEQLECRRLMTANLISKLPPGTTITKLLKPDVTTSVSSKHVLSITGNGGNDAISITQTSPNEFTVTGLNGTTIDKTHTSLNFKGITGDVDVKFSGAAESLSIGDGSAPTNFAANLNVNMGNGANTFSMYNVKVNGNVTLNGGTGSDNVLISESNIGIPTVNKGANGLAISLGGGNNVLAMFSTNVEQNVSIFDQASAGDTITIANDTVGGNMYLFTGNGADSVTLSGVTIVSQLQLETAGGNDHVYLGGQEAGVVAPVVADQVFLDLGDGTDTLQIGGDAKGNKAGGVFANDGADYMGGAGSDSLTYLGYEPRSGTYSGFEFAGP